MATGRSSLDTKRTSMRSGETTAAAARFGAHGEDPDAFQQRRVANAALFGAAFGMFFLVLRSILMFVGRGFRGSDLHLHALSILPLTLVWLSCRKGGRSPKFVTVAELAGTAMACTLVIALGAKLPLLGNPPVLVTVIVGALLMARAIYVPSPARRTVGLGIFLTVPFLILVLHTGSRWTPDLLQGSRGLFREVSGTAQFAVLTMGWWATFVVLSGIASYVVYGLQARVREFEQLGQYQLEDLLGEGGMGMVYRARHALLQRPTAVKLLPPDRVGEESIARFEREVRQTARLTHPNTITIYDYGRTPEGVFYYAMELLDGVSLERVIQATGPMAPARVLHVLRQVAGSLAEAHSFGLVHRDIKPDNIMLCAQGGIVDVVKVLDFGLVKEVKRTEDARLTAQNVVLGTPQYMAPEAIKDTDGIDGRADIYSLGATAFYLLTAQDVFEADTVVELCSHHLHSEPKPPSQIVDIAARFDDVVLQCLAKDPKKRPQDARALDAMLSGLDIAPWRQEDADAWWTNHGASLDRPPGVSVSAPTVRHTSNPDNA